MTSFLGENEVSENDVWEYNEWTEDLVPNRQDNQRRARRRPESSNPAWIPLSEDIYYWPEEQSFILTSHGNPQLFSTSTQNASVQYRRCLEYRARLNANKPKPLLRGGAIHDALAAACVSVESCSVYSPANKEEVRLVYRIIDCNNDDERHQMVFKFATCGSEDAAWVEAQRVREFIDRENRLPPKTTQKKKQMTQRNTRLNARSTP